MNAVYVPFKPVYRSEDIFVVSEEPLNEEFKTNIKFVLNYYKVPYQVDDTGDILIPESLWDDKDTMWNYTTKANDSNWLESRPTWDNKP